MTFVSFGDMLRVPGSASDLLHVKSAGADVRVVYSPLDAVRLAQARPDREVVFFGIGFETTAPDNRVEAFLAAGHVCTVMGWTEYEPIASGAGSRPVPGRSRLRGRSRWTRPPFPARCR